MLLTPSRLWRCITAGWCLLLGVLPGNCRAAPITLSDNLAAPTAYTEAVQGQTWVGTPFRTEKAVKLDTISLLLASPVAGTAVLTLYSGTDQPETLIGGLTPLESSAIDGLFLAPFYANGLSLDAASSYWVVLRTLSGRFEWAFTDSDTGTGPGFTPGWAVTDDGGASWFTQQSEPMQMRVEAVEAQVVPEPGSFALTALGAGVCGLLRWKHNRTKPARQLMSLTARLPR